MEALDQSDELLQRGDKLRARSARMRTAAAERTDKSRRLFAVAARARQAVVHAYGWEPCGPDGKTPATNRPAGR